MFILSLTLLLGYLFTLLLKQYPLVFGAEASPEFPKEEEATAITP